MKIKQVVIVIILIASLIGSIIPALFAAEIPTSDAHARAVSIESVSAIRADNPGILQTNPFYFVKEWSRGIHRVFAFSPVAKLQFDFKVATDKAAELKRLEEIGMADVDGLRAAISDYGDSLKPLSARLLSVDMSANSEILAKLVLQTSTQANFLEELKSRHAELVIDIETAQSYLRAIEEASTR